ncbi:uncharacterized protein B0H64DRAFT_420690 [Chaetomium fimeti]|uniref:Uncharacterized protein n=1 Tax=Chaetomium fimeti TaxID=1854472 RepID=A0AAE0H6J3_9PEZI|nr:hypothetical protein B0H64DRAFT_420690 [Chaetomium fimeti]
MRLQIDLSDVAIEKNEEIHELHLWGVQTSNHRRIVILQSEFPWLNLVWADVKDSHLIIDHPVFDGFFGEPRGGSFWLDLAVINPAVDSALFRKIGHGIAMGFSAGMMDPHTKVEARWRNGAAANISGPGYKALWPGPLVFFSYGYGLSDYVKVDPAQSDNVECGVEAKMSNLEIWNELDKMRKEAGKTVWKWKVKEHGTSMKVLDLTHRDLGTVLDYMSRSQLNPIPHIPRRWNIEDLQAKQVNPMAQTAAENQFNDALTVQSSKGENISIRHVVLPTITMPFHPMLGAFAVGIQWVVYYSMDINPPFRAKIPWAERWPIMDLTWAVEIRESAPEIALHVPISSCDSVVVMDADGGPIDPHHVRALYKYLKHTDPRQWSRRGARGFENYWAVYAKVDLGGAKVPDVYPPWDALDPINQNDWIMTHMTLEQLCPEDLERKEEIEKTRQHMLDTVSWYRNNSPGRGFPCQSFLKKLSEGTDII